MNITSPLMPRAAANDAGSSSGTPNTPAGLNNMFLQLLVAQLQNQNPLDPMDPTQFVGQLAQFSELSEITQIDQILQQNLPSGSAQIRGPAGQSLHPNRDIDLRLTGAVETPTSSTASQTLNVEGLFSKGNLAPIQ